jgi:hypothetical protein
MLIKNLNTNNIKEFLNNKYPNETFSIESVGIDMKNMEIIACICDSGGIESTIRKKGSVIYSDYELDKATSLIENELTEVLRKSELIKHIKHMDVIILERIEYSEIFDGLNPVIYLTVEYNNKFSSKRDFAQMSYDVIRIISKSKYSNVGTYVFSLTTEHDAMNLVVFSEDLEADFDILLDKVEVVKENKAD